MVTVLFFASLREQTGQSRVELDWKDGMTTGGLWQQIVGDDGLAESTLVACNQEYCHADTMVADGDEVAFFPPVTGG
ncbi:MAG: molybdopterin converting factor subunit 1 [Thiolinea sp.]